MSTFGADTDDDVTDHGQENVDGEVRRLREALRLIVSESPQDTPYSWCQEKLARCNEIARNALEN